MKWKWLNRLFGNNKPLQFTSTDIRPLISTMVNIEIENIENREETELKQKAIDLRDFFGSNVSLDIIIELLKKYENSQTAINNYYDNLIH